MNKIKQFSEVAEEIAAVQKNMKTSDDDNNTMSSTTKDDSHLLKMKLTFSRSQTTPEDKGYQSRGKERVSHAFAKQYTRHDTQEDQNQTLPLFPEASKFTRIAQNWLGPGTDNNVIYNRIIACFTIDLK